MYHICMHLCHRILKYNVIQNFLSWPITFPKQVFIFHSWFSFLLELYLLPDSYELGISETISFLTASHFDEILKRKESTNFVQSSIPVNILWQFDPLWGDPVRLTGRTNPKTANFDRLTFQTLQHPAPHIYFDCIAMVDTCSFILFSAWRAHAIMWQPCCMPRLTSANTKGRAWMHPHQRLITGRSHESVSWVHWSPVK